LREHCKRVQGQKGIKSLFVVGDMNVAPTWEDTTVPAADAEWYPSNKPYEREAYYRLLKECKLHNMAEHLAPEGGRVDRTWMKGRPGAPNYMAMRLDHVLGPVEGGVDDPKVSTIEVGTKTYGSDHFPVFYTITLGSQKRTGSSSPMVPTKLRNESDQKARIEDAIRRLRWQQQTELAKKRGPPTLARFATASPLETLSKLPELPANDHARVFSNCIHQTMDLLGAGPRGIRKSTPTADTVNATCTNRRKHTISEYTPYRGQGLPHEHCKIVPETNLSFGESKVVNVRAMWDTGACYNILTKDLAKRLGLSIDTERELPLLELANGAITTPIGTTSSIIHFNSSLSMGVQFFVFNGAPNEAIFGSDFMEQTGAVISFQEKTVTINAPGNACRRTSFSFKPTLAARLSSAAAMHACNSITIPANSEATVPVKFTYSREGTPSQWGVVEDANLHACKVARGITCAVQSQGQHHGYHCKIINASERDVIIRTEKPVAMFRPIDPEEYDIVDTKGLGLGEADIDPAVETMSAIMSSATTISSSSMTKNIDVEWASHPHLCDLDLSVAKDALSQPEFDNLRTILLKYNHLWDTRPKEPPPFADKCTILLEGTDPFNHFARTRPMGPNERVQLREIVQGQLLKRIIEPSTSPHASAVILVPKKGGGVRFCIDYRALNSKVKADSWTLPNVEESMSSLHGNTWFTSLDMKEAFWSVPLDEESKAYTAFQTPDGLMQYRRMPMGLKTASAVFCRYVDRMLGSMKWTSVLAYVDDLLIFGKTFHEHLNCIDQLLGRLAKYNMTLGAKKCTFFASSVAFLGHIVDRKGIRPDPNKTKAIEAIELPQCVKEMQSALGLMQYYRKFVEGFSKVSAPLRKKMNSPSAWRKTNGKVTYSPDEIQAFEKLKNALGSKPILGHPDWDSPFQLHTDASYQGLGAALVQIVDGKERVIQYASRSLVAAENNYAVWELECLAIVWAMRLFRMYIQCSKFTVYTDSIAAKRIVGNPSADSGGRILRWALAVQEFDFTVEHRKATRHGNADGLSRLAQSSTSPYGEDPTTIEPSTMLPACTTPAAALSGFDESKAFFPPEDNEAHTATDFATLQARDPWCQRQALHASTKIEAKPGHIFKDKERGGLLLRKSTSATSQDQVLVPLSLRAFILRRYHGLPVSAHLGRRRTYAQIKRSYYWPGLSKDVGRWIGACLACRQRKTPRPKSAGTPGAVSTATRPWEIVAIDIVSSGVTSKGNYTKILTIIDLFTRYVMAIPLHHATAQEIGDALFNHLYCRFGKPQRIHSDEGREFVNTALTGMFKKWGISFTSTGGYQPQANPVERYHRFMNSAMTMLAKAFGSDWPSYLPAVCFAYNASTNDATGFTPYELIFGGRKPTLLQTIDAAVHETDDLQPVGSPDKAEYHEKAATTLKTAYTLVRKQQEKLAKANREAILRRRGANRKDGAPPKLQEHDVGDLVLFWEPSQPKIMQTPEQRLESLVVMKAPKKWKDSWTGPHEVVSKKKDDTGFRYEIYHKKRGTKLSTHVNKLCRFQPWAEGITSTSSTIDGKALYKCGEWVQDGALVIVPLLKPYPFGVAKLISCEAEGDMKLQWLGNDNNNVKHDFLPGWRSTKRSKPYYSMTPRSASHKPYTTEDDGITMNQRDVLMHSFELTKNSRLPAPLLRAIARHPYVWWDPTTKQE
jgi:hypothetical protein